MKNKTPLVAQRNNSTVPDWLYQESFMASRQGEYSSMLQATQEDDFLLGKSPNDLEFTWEEDE